MDNNKQEKKERKTKTIMKRKVDPVFLVVQCYCKAPCDHMKRGADNCTVHHYCYCNYSYVAVVPTCISMEENTKQYSLLTVWFGCVCHSCADMHIKGGEHQVVLTSDGTVWLCLSQLCRYAYQWRRTPSSHHF